MTFGGPFVLDLASIVGGGIGYIVVVVVVVVGHGRDRLFLMAIVAIIVVVVRCRGSGMVVVVVDMSSSRKEMMNELVVGWWFGGSLGGGCWLFRSIGSVGGKIGQSIVSREFGNAGGGGGGSCGKLGRTQRIVISRAHMTLSFGKFRLFLKGRRSSGSHAFVLDGRLFAFGNGFAFLK